LDICREDLLFYSDLNLFADLFSYLSLFSAILTSLVEKLDSDLLIIGERTPGEFSSIALLEHGVENYIILLKSSKFL